MNTQRESSGWIKIALEAFDLVYATDGTKKNIDQDTLVQSIYLFYQSISAGADKYWPYIKLADLVEDPKEKIKLYIQAFRVEPNNYSALYLFDKILEDNPNILDKYYN